MRDEINALDLDAMARRIFVAMLSRIFNTVSKIRAENTEAELRKANG